ncbi:MAG: hypothetical protein R2880_03635 [Deinococcales bacterium]
MKAAILKDRRRYSFSDYFELNDATSTRLYGAITLGDIWKFAILERQRKHIIKDIHSYTIPTNTKEIFSMMMGILA